jgi:hypothetical protein
MEDSMARLTKELEQPDVLLSAWEQSVVRAADAKVAEAEAALAQAQTHFSRFSDHEMSIAALTALDSLKHAQTALADARAAAAHTLEQARLGLHELRLPEENRLRLLQYRKAAELKAVTEELFAYVTESRNLGATAPSPMVGSDQIVPFATLLDEEPYRASALVHVARDLQERGIAID